ncbi:hypothetical protein E1B28_007787 [Marasmius oreades]|uniref:CNH domain-containing protein n=1 Tax=Marasmius oreades TaxID=181124 RepID=A0A9P7S2W7_9AGAR|nr:uncharacterized protein E1B28_007787 [Marasmius oreades]KAG7094178.1 hypothetical protein E1B28_007787 [Marasmius oreades]
MEDEGKSQQVFDTKTIFTIGSEVTSKVICSVPFRSPDGEDLIAIGCAEGIWVGCRNDPQSLRRVLLVKKLSQFAILEDIGIFVVLADKALYAYHIEALFSASPSHQQASQRAYQISERKKDVHYFNGGYVQGRRLIVYVKSGSLSSTFYILEADIPRISSSESGWFKSYKKFYIPRETHDVIFLNTKLAVLHIKGVDVLDPFDLQTMTIPSKDDFKSVVDSKLRSSFRPLGMFRVPGDPESDKDEFLICYSNFGLYLDSLGEPTRSKPVVSWGVEVQHAALLNSSYIALFSRQSVEIRGLYNGEVTQVIKGKDVRCVWDGRVTTIADPHDAAVDRPRALGMMNSEEIPGCQKVFEVLPVG